MPEIKTNIRLIELMIVIDIFLLSFIPAIIPSSDIIYIYIIIKNHLH